MLNVLKILILYDANSTYVNTTYEHLLSFQVYSKHEIHYISATGDVICPINLNDYDVIIFHYSVRLCLTWHLSSSFAEALQSFVGYKILFIQDEYEATEVARKSIETLNFNVVFTCVPEKFINTVYPSERFKKIIFRNNLTGYVPNDYHYLGQFYKPIAERKLMIGYRGRPLGYWYGNLGQEKVIIGKKMKEICEAKKINADIEWEEYTRIYGDKWYEFLADCKATLGSESGSNIFDFDGNLREQIEGVIQKKPNITYQEVFDKYLAAHEGKIIMNQISPKVFEAIALKTALVLFEGAYSGVVLPDVHYIPLKKDFSNADEVLEKLADDTYLERLTEQAYKDIIASEKYSYRTFIANFDNFIADKVVSKNRQLSIMFNVDDSVMQLSKQPSLLHFTTNLPLRRDMAKGVKIFQIINKELSLFVKCKKIISFVWKKLPMWLRYLLIKLLPKKLISIYQT